MSSKPSWNLQIRSDNSVDFSLSMALDVHFLPVHAPAALLDSWLHNETMLLADR